MSPIIDIVSSENISKISDRLVSNPLLNLQKNFHRYLLLDFEPTPNRSR